MHAQGEAAAAEGPQVAQEKVVQRRGIGPLKDLERLAVGVVVVVVVVVVGGG